MHPVATLVVAASAVVVFIVLVAAFTGIWMPRLPVGKPAPAPNQDAALALLARLQAADGPEVATPCRSQLLRPQGPARGTIILWHGFTNCPPQYAELAEILCAEGYFVLVPRAPRHGYKDVLTRDLKNLTAEEIVTFGHACVDIGAGLPGPLYVAGLSVGATIAAWAGTVRPEIERVVAMAPLTQPVGIPVPIGRLLVRIRPIVPAIWIWWDPRKKADLGESPYVYPGFPLPGLIPFLHIGESLLDGHTSSRKRVQRVALTTNPGDFAIRKDAARKMMRRAYAGRADKALELTLDKSLGWWHDFIDQAGAHHGDPEQVAALVLAALGENDDTSAGGVIATTADLFEGDKA
jgi:alpha-beta hydrolase superfamily lysophospholipase